MYTQMCIFVYRHIYIYIYICVYIHIYIYLSLYRTDVYYAVFMMPVVLQKSNVLTCFSVPTPLRIAKGPFKGPFKEAARATRCVAEASPRSG